MQVRAAFSLLRIIVVRVMDQNGMMLPLLNCILANITAKVLSLQPGCHCFHGRPLGFASPPFDGFAKILSF